MPCKCGYIILYSSGNNTYQIKIRFRFNMIIDLKHFIAHNISDLEADELITSPTYNTDYRSFPLLFVPVNLSLSSRKLPSILRKWSCRNILQNPEDKLRKVLQLASKCRQATQHDINPSYIREYYP